MATAVHFVCGFPVSKHSFHPWRQEKNKEKMSERRRSGQCVTTATMSLYFLFTTSTTPLYCLFTTATTQVW
jgi:hypothetical protein